MQNSHNKFINYKYYKTGFIDVFLKNKTTILLIALIILYVLFYFLLDSSSQSLVAHDEGLYARRSRIVEEYNSWLAYPFSVPHHKTIGSYWLIALSIRFFGNSELALRLPSILTSFLCLFISYLIALKISNKKSALISIFSLSSMPLWIQYSRYASPDIPFVLCILLVICFFLEFLHTNKLNYKYIYIFSSGFFISTAFFIRSYMVFVPIIGLSPFFLFHLFRTKVFIKITFFSGLLIGSIPTFLSLYLSYKKLGIETVTSLFNFARDQAIGGFNFNSLFLIPFKYLYLTFPVGIIFLLLLLFTCSKNTTKYPLLIYVYPLISFSILLCMSTTFPHYYLFLLPSLSILFAIKLQNFSFRFSFSKTLIRYILLLFILLISFGLVFILFYYKSYLLQFTFIKTLLVFTVTLFLLFFFIYSIKFLFGIKKENFNLTMFFYTIIIPQYIFLSLLYNFGVIGNPNHKMKSFLVDKSVSSIVKSNTIFLYNVDSKIKTLLSYYLPNSSVVNYFDDFNNIDYIITSDKEFLNENQNNNKFKTIKEFDNHYLLININK